MTIKTDVLNELNMQDGIKFRTLQIITEHQESSLSPALRVMKADGLIEQVDGLYYITGAGKSQIKALVPDNPTPAPLPEKQTEKPAQQKQSESALNEQLDKLRQQLTDQVKPERQSLKIKTCERLAELLRDDIGDLLLEIAQDYKEITGQG